MTSDDYKRVRIKVGPSVVGTWDSRFDLSLDLNSQYDQASALLHEGFYTEALGVLDWLADELPEHPYVQNLMGVVFGQMDRPEVALERFERALECTPQDITDFRANILSNIGATHLKLGRADTAEKYFLRALEKDPLSVTAIANLGMIYHQRRNYSQARELYESVLEMGILQNPVPDCVSGVLAGLLDISRKTNDKDLESRVLKLWPDMPPQHAYFIEDGLAGNRKVRFYNRRREGDEK